MPHSQQYLPLFVFGTLRRGEENHHYLAGSYDRTIAATLRDYRRAIAAHGYPAIIPSPGNCVEGELYFLNRPQFEKTLANCDLLEDLPPGELVGLYYCRARVAVETAEGLFTAWAYVSP